VLYWSDHVEDVRREVYRMADAYQTECLMRPLEGKDPMTAMGLNYIRFAAQEKHLFRLLFQSDSFRGQSVTELVDLPELTPVLEIIQREAGMTLAQTKTVFRSLLLLVHGWASLLANNAMAYDEHEIIPTLEMAFMGMIGAVKMQEVHDEEAL